MAYSLTTSYAGEALLSGFNWYNGSDPSHGCVAYQDQASAQSMGLYSIDSNGVVRLGVDHKNKYSVNEGRPSIRIESKESFGHGLFIADFLHMPPSQCGLWPAFWAYGSDWPNNGEIDIIEGVNTAHSNIISAHTKNGCTQSPSLKGLYTGQERNSECGVGSDNVGCGFDPPTSDSSSYGDGFNAVNGGVYAMKWDSEHISIWHFPRGSIPADIQAKNPNPSTWGLPQAIFGGSGCDVDSYWNNMNIVLNINFCGDYGNGVWGKSDTCNQYAPTCSEYVANNPEAFANAYWDVQYIDAYALNPNAANTKTSTKSLTPATAGGSTTAKTMSSLTTKGQTPATTGESTTVKPMSSLTTKGQTPDTTSESTTTTTMTRFITKTVTIDGTPIAISVAATDTSTFTIPANNTLSTHTKATTASFTVPTSVNPIATKTPVNPAKIGNFSYLGCFDSSSGFKTFNQVADKKDMTLEQCVNLCQGKTYAGIFDTKCFCADELDAGTRAEMSEEMCKQACPGDKMEFCGGVVVNPRQKNQVGGSAPLANSRFRGRRAIPDTFALSVYGSVSNEKPLSPPPAMASGSNKTSVTSVPVSTPAHVKETQSNCNSSVSASTTTAKPHDSHTNLRTTVVPATSVVTVYPVPETKDRKYNGGTTLLTEIVTKTTTYCPEEATHKSQPEMSSSHKTTSIPSSPIVISSASSTQTTHKSQSQPEMSSSHKTTSVLSSLINIPSASPTQSTMTSVSTLVTSTAPTLVPFIPQPAQPSSEPAPAPAPAPSSIPSPPPPPPPASPSVSTAAPVEGPAETPAESPAQSPALPPQVLTAAAPGSSVPARRSLILGFAILVLVFIMA